MKSFKKKKYLIIAIFLIFYSVFCRVPFGYADGDDSGGSGGSIDISNYGYNVSDPGMLYGYDTYDYSSADNPLGTGYDYSTADNPVDSNGYSGVSVVTPDPPASFWISSGPNATSFSPETSPYVSDNNSGSSIWESSPSSPNSTWNYNPQSSIPNVCPSTGCSSFSDTSGAQIVSPLLQNGESTIPGVIGPPAGVQNLEGGWERSPNGLIVSDDGYSLIPSPRTSSTGSNIEVKGESAIIVNNPDGSVSVFPEQNNSTGQSLSSGSSSGTGNSPSGTNSGLTSDYNSVAGSIGLPQTNYGQAVGTNPYTGQPVYSSPSLIASDYNSLAGTLGISQINPGQAVGVNLTTGQPVYSPSGLSSLGSFVTSGLSSAYNSLAGVFGLYTTSGGTVVGSPTIIGTSPITGQPIYSSTGSTIYSANGTPIYSSSGTPVYSSAGQPIYTSTGQPVVGSNDSVIYPSSSATSAVYNPGTSYPAATGSNVLYDANGNPLSSSSTLGSSLNPATTLGNSNLLDSNGLGTNGLATGGGWNIGNLSGFGLPSSSISGIVSAALMWILGIFGAIGVIGFVISGIMYLTAAGDQTQAERAKKAMTYSIIGIVVALSGLVIITAVNMLLSGSSQI